MSNQDGQQKSDQELKDLEAQRLALEIAKLNKREKELKNFEAQRLALQIHEMNQGKQKTFTDAPTLTTSEPPADTPQTEQATTEAEAEQTVTLPATWANEDWYKLLSVEDRQRYDWLRPHKEDWESGELTEKELAASLGKTTDTTRRWRRELKKKAAPDMEWKKQQAGRRKKGVR